MDSYVSHANLIGDGNDTASGTLLGRGMKVVHYIGSGDVLQFRMGLTGWSLGGTDVEGAILPGNDYSIPEMWVTKAGDPTGVRVTWSGVNNVTVPDGATLVLSDLLTAADFGFVGSIPRGTVFYVGYGATVAAAGMSWPGGDGGHGGTLGGFQGFAYNPANTGLTNLEGSGAMWVNGAEEIGSTNNNLSPPVLMIGEFTSDSTPVFCAIGDSITYALNDEGGGIAEGRGWFTRALFDDSSALTNPRAGMKLAKSGGLPSVWNPTSANGAYDKLTTLAGYANRFIERYGINAINTQGDQALADQLHASKKVIWDAVRDTATRPVLVACASLTPKTSSTDGWATVENQTPASGLGGQIALLDADLAAAAGTPGELDFYIENTADLRGSSDKADADYWRWAVGATVDGVHPQPDAHAELAVEVRVWMQGVLVPDVVGLTQADAVSALEALGFDVVVTTAESDTVPAGQVISQDPASGTFSTEGAVVTLLISTGSGVVPIDATLYGGKKKRQHKNLSFKPNTTPKEAAPDAIKPAPPTKRASGLLLELLARVDLPAPAAPVAVTAPAPVVVAEAPAPVVAAAPAPAEAPPAAPASDLVAAEVAALRDRIGSLEATLMMLLSSIEQRVVEIHRDLSLTLPIESPVSAPEPIAVPTKLTGEALRLENLKRAKSLAARLLGGHLDDHV